MSKEVHIDQFIQEKLEFLTIPYEDSFWKDAEKLIINAEKEKRRRFLWWIFIVTLILASLIMYSVLSSPNNNDYSSIKVNPKSSIDTSIPQSATKNQIFIYSSSLSNKQKGKMGSLSNFNQGRIFNRKKKGSIEIINTQGMDDNSIEFRDSIKNIKNQKQIDSLEALKTIRLLNNYKLDIPNEFNLWLSEEEYQKKYNRNTAFVGISLGATINENGGLAYFGSLHAQKILSKKWSTRIAAQLVSTKFPFLLYKYSSVDYSFGEVVKNTEIKSDVVYSIQVPISFHYRFYKFHSALVGVGYSKYIAQKNSIITEIGGEKFVTHEVGISKDFRNDNLFASIGYESLLFQKYNVGVSAQMPLLNPIVNQLKINGTTKINYAELKVYVLYNFIKLR